ncbi:MAG: hypothetical protein LUQ50_13390 [Methanospirillum sp.]|uniref:hypothetical protein n=1 Tax=Methanospirillum sp. TaxID=45200 RepID=UPI00236F3405|nr:hypothetical protein [Methanospirillum sp.]MDD1730049.1 hypothetical protein [Methanospirillum sp.]
MPWKIPWQQKNQPGSDQAGSFYSLLRSSIGEIRKQGEPPVRDIESFSRYTCDLCHGAVPVSSLRQCVICGRWACPDCWKEEYYVCSSCNGIIRLHLMKNPEIFHQPDCNTEPAIEQEIKPEI